MKIIVLIKQVPATDAVEMDPVTGTMVRDGVEAIVNPLDLYAIECAVNLRGQAGGEVVVLSMGPAKALAALREAVAMGCDSAVLLSGKELAGSDTWATAYVLAQAVRKLGGADLILCGERATDGDTGQVGPAVAAFLDLPVITYAAALTPPASGAMEIRRLIEEGYETLSVTLPAVVSVLKEAASPRLPTLLGKRKARSLAIPVWGAAELGLNAADIGLHGSPTRVVKVFHPKVARKCEKVAAGDEASVSKAADRFVEFLRERQLL